MFFRKRVILLYVSCAVISFSFCATITKKLKMFPLALKHLLDMHVLRVFYSLGGSHNRVYHLEQDEAIYL